MMEIKQRFEKIIKNNLKYCYGSWSLFHDDEYFIISNENNFQIYLTKEDVPELWKVLNSYILDNV